MDLLLRKFYSTRNLKISNDYQLQFLQRLTRLLKYGYPILEALETIKWDKNLTTPATQVIISLKGGDTIDQALEKAQFHHSIISFLYFVRVNGDLIGSLEKCNMMFTQRLANAKKFKQILRYPVILLVIFSTLLYFIKQSVLPSFANMFQASSESSSPVLFSIKIIDLLGTVLLSFGFLLLLINLIWHFIKPKLSIETRINIYKKLPVFRSYLKTQTSYFFATHFSSLLKTGMSFKEILQHMTNQKKLPIVALYSSLLTEELTKGVHLSYVLSRFYFLNDQLISIFQKNTDEYMLERDLSIYAELLMEEIESKTMKAITLIQPTIFIILGGFIIFIYATLMWPMFQLIKTV